MEKAGKVAIVGAGPSGLVVARYLLLHGFTPVIFEQGSRVGGQWNQGASHSGIWPTMVTNTSRVTTHFSDIPWPPETHMFPHNRDVQAYLERYADAFGITERIRFQNRVDSINREADGYQVTSIDPDGQRHIETFPYVVVASGRYSAPTIPTLPGIETFSGAKGVSHAFEFRDPDHYRGQRVVVAGCSISAVEIAPELAMGGAQRVVSCFRRQRYILQRIVAGVPIDILAFNRFGVLAAERLPPEVVKRSIKEFIVRTSGTPDQWGARQADDDPFVAGITQGQFYLPLVAEGRIISKPWIRSIHGQHVTFDDGSEEEADGLIFGTGFHLHLPFLSAPLRELLGADGPALRLYRHTFHPQLPGLAFVGLYHQGGPYFPPVELQARWVAYTWAGLCPRPSDAKMLQEIASEAPTEQPERMHRRCIAFARDAGVEPELERWPELTRALLFGPLAAISFRLSGPDALPDAAVRLAAEAAEFGAVTSPQFTVDEQIQWDLLRQAATGTA